MTTVLTATHYCQKKATAEWSLTILSTSTMCSCFSTKVQQHCMQHSVTAPGTVPVERTEPGDTPSKQLQEEQWYASVNSECRCKGNMRCGDRYREIVQERRALGPCCKNNLKRIKKLRHGLTVELHQQKARCHNHAASPTRDLLRMPHELLPYLRVVCAASPMKWPFVTKATARDVKAMTLVCCRQEQEALYAPMWQTMQARMQQYAETGSGTLAEAIVYNDCYWSVKSAHETPSDQNAVALLLRSVLIRDFYIRRSKR
jgi:hypothetical protein